MVINTPWGMLLRWIKDNANEIGIDDLVDVEVIRWDPLYRYRDHHDIFAQHTIPEVIRYAYYIGHFTPLSLAATAKRRDLVEKLLRDGYLTDHFEAMLKNADWESDDIREMMELRFDKSPDYPTMVDAIYPDDVERLRNLLDQGGDPNRQPAQVFKDSHPILKPTLLHIAITRGRVACAELLVSRGAEIPASVMEQIFCLSRNCYPMAQMFLAAGVKIPTGSVDSGGETLAAIVCHNWHCYSDKERTALLGLLIKHGADVTSAPTDTGATPLMFAAAQGDIRIISLLLGAGADPKARDNEGRSALDFAQMRGRTEAVERLQAAIQHT